jgi:peptidoglycan/LPS O-acetylase OafA/YrhL
MSARRIMDIEVLRAIAVLGVLFHHLQGNLFTGHGAAAGNIHAWAQPWWGVDLFLRSPASSSRVA